VILGQWQRAERSAEEQRHTAYTFGINLTQQVLERDNTGRALDLLEGLKPLPGEKDLRGFEWYYLIGMCHGESLTLPRNECAAISPDGRFLAGGGKKGSLKIWDGRGQEIATLHGHTGDVTAVVFSLDGKLLVSAAKDNTIKVWDWQHGTEKVHLPTEHTAWPLALAMHPDGGSVASGGKDGTILIWDVRTGTKQAMLRRPNESIVALAVRPERRIVAAGTRARKVGLWNRQADAEPKSIDHHSFGTVQCVAFSPDGQWLATAVSDKTIRLWDATSLQALGELRGHTAKVASLAFAPNGD